jgi:hypothetical protein
MNITLPIVLATALAGSVISAAPAVLFTTHEMI